MEIVKCPGCGSGDVTIYSDDNYRCRKCGQVWPFAKNAINKKVDLTGRSMDFKMGYAYGVRDGENREWERRQKMENATSEKFVAERRGNEVCGDHAVACPYCKSTDIYRDESDLCECNMCGKPFIYVSKEMADAQRAALRDAISEGATHIEPYPQDAESNEYRYLSPAWLDAIAMGLTAGAVKHPGETWRTIPAKEHAWRAVRHLILWLCGDREDKHLVNASMRCMMAWETDRAENSREEWEKKMKEKGFG